MHPLLQRQVVPEWCGVSDLRYICHEANGDFERAPEGDLRRWLEHRCLSIEGDKGELVARIRADDRNPGKTCKCTVCPRWNQVACDDDCADPLPKARSEATPQLPVYDSKEAE